MHAIKALQNMKRSFLALADSHSLCCFPWGAIVAKSPDLIWGMRYLWWHGWGRAISLKHIKNERGQERKLSPCFSGCWFNDYVCMGRSLQTLSIVRDIYGCVDWRKHRWSGEKINDGLNMLWNKKWLEVSPHTSGEALIVLLLSK